MTTAQDERGRDTVYRCFDGAGLPWIAPVGRLDKASEGLLLFSNDPQWAARLTDPETGPQKTYHVQVDRLPDDATLAALQAGVEDEGEFLVAQAVRVLRSGDKTAWLEVVLDEGRNRHIRRLLAAFDLQVLRLVRVAIGGLQLGDLGKGQWRMLEVNDQQRLGPLHRADHRPRPAVAGHRSRRRGAWLLNFPNGACPCTTRPSTKPCAAQACCCRWCC